MKHKLIAAQLTRHRKRLKITQDQLGQEFNASGAAIFKFEKGYVCPGLPLWLKLAKAMGIETRQAVIMWAKDKLPDQYKSHIADGVAKRTGPAYENFAAQRTADKLKAAMIKNKWLPSGLSDLAKNKGLWAMYRPTGAEINVLRDIFAPIGEGTARDFCGGLRLVREFQGKKV